MRARVEADLRLTSTTDDRIESLIAEAARLRSEYGVPTGFQRAPFFEIQTDRFALVAIDTGVAQADRPEQWTWLERRSTARPASSMMAVLGHPFYAGGHDMTRGRRATSRGSSSCCVEHGVTIVMAGDTHDLEYYVEPREAATPAVHYFVNGGGGAYLSFGTALELAGHSRRPPSGPSIRAATASRTRSSARRRGGSGRPGGGRSSFDAWPFSAEWLSAAVRLQRGAVLSELRRGPGRAVGAAGSHHSLRRARSPHLGGSCEVGHSSIHPSRRSDICRVGGRDDALGSPAPPSLFQHPLATVCRRSGPLDLLVAILAVVVDLAAVRRRSWDNVGHPPQAVAMTVDGGRITRDSGCPPRWRR